MSDLRWGLIGTGGIARAFARDLTRTSGHTIAAVGSRTLAKATEFAQQSGGIPYGSYEELVAADIDAVYVATPHPPCTPRTQSSRSITASPYSARNPLRLTLMSLHR